ncbi:MAG: winged helix DNA-binding domain-containing protein [Georgenia sp.]
MRTRDVALLRLAAQRIAGPGFASAAETVRWLTAVQAQDYPGALASVALRTEGDAGGILGAFDAGEVVRSWPMRGTLHLVPAVDLGWMLGLTSERLLAQAARRRASLGIDRPLIGKAAELTQQALAGGRSLRRGELMEVWERAGLLAVPQRGYHLLWTLSQRGLTCFGPTVDGEQRIVLLAEWVPRPRRLDRDEALAEWALRYFRSHGPATRKDFAWWTKLPMADVATGLAGAVDQLDRVDVDGVEHYLDPATPARLEEVGAAARGVHLLPGFDELILGYQDRSPTLAPEFADRIVPGGNGMFRPTVVAAGRVVGTWRRAGRGRDARIEAEPFTRFTQQVERAVPRVAGRYPAPLATVGAHA